MKFNINVLNRHWKNILEKTNGNEDTDNGLYIHFSNGKSISILDVEKWIAMFNKDVNSNNEDDFILLNAKLVERG